MSHYAQGLSPDYPGPGLLVPSLASNDHLDIFVFLHLVLFPLLIGMPLPLRQPGSLRAPFLLINLRCSFNQQTFDGHLLYRELQAGGRNKAGLCLPLCILQPQTGDRQEIIMSPRPGEATVLCAICLRGQKEKDTQPRT